MKVIICPVGTSILTNACEGGLRNQIIRNANVKRREELPPEWLPRLDAHLADRADMVGSMDALAAKAVSAELHGLLILMEQSPPEPRDAIYLISSDTYLGNITFGLVRDYLERKKLDVRELRIAGLQTKSSEDLRGAFIQLVREVDAIHGQYKPQAARLIFNLTGGFKAVQGFLQTLSAIYADETVYIFEQESDLMRIPKLPLKIVPQDYILQNVTLWRRLEACLPVDAGGVAALPETFYYPYDGGFMLSEYGELVWKGLKGDLYSQKLWDPPSELIIYAVGFPTSCAGLPPDRLFLLNRRIDDLADHLENRRQRGLQSLDLKQLKVPLGASTHELDAWADQVAKRVFCHYEGKRLVLDRLGQALH